MDAIGVTCKQLIENLHEMIWMCFWLSIAVHIFLGVFIPLMREFVRALKESHDRNFKDHEDLGKMINRNNRPE